MTDGIFTSLRLENFKNSGVREVSFDRVAVVGGGLGSSKSQILDAMSFLHGITKGKEASDYPASWFGTDGWPTEISISFNSPQYGKLTYSVVLLRIDDHRVRVKEERLSNKSEEFLIRRRHSYIISSRNGRYGIGTSEFALYDAARVLKTEGPIGELYSELGLLWILDPNPARMSGSIGFTPVKADDRSAADLATCMVMQQKNNPDVFMAMTDKVCHVCPDLVSQSMELDSKGLPYLAIHRRSDLDTKGTSFGEMDSGIKMLYLSAFVGAMNERSTPVNAVWSSPLNWFGGEEREAVSNLLHNSFSSKGQLMMLA